MKKKAYINWSKGYVNPFNMKPYKNGFLSRKLTQFLGKWPSKISDVVCVNLIFLG